MPVQPAWQELATYDNGQPGSGHNRRGRRGGRVRRQLDYSYRYRITPINVILETSAW